ncbi:MAG TPA: ZIP family metal transporter [Vicinamibacterales bacterium]|nr:ZIP family metal transporter [Vicinamibacterales bacterium]
MRLLATAVGLCLIGSVAGVAVTSSLVFSPDRIRTRLVPLLVSYAVGALLGVALLALLPEALDERKASTTAVFGELLAGVLLFFVLEKILLYRHCHTDDCAVHGATAPLVFVGDAFHNFFDGAIIASAVMTSVPLGVNTTIAIAAHEIPQEIGDVAILLASGYSRGGALMLNVATGASSVAGALVAYAAISIVPGLGRIVLPFAAGSMLYIAMSDLIPDLHRGGIDSNAPRQVALIVAGIATVAAFERLFG